MGVVVGHASADLPAVDIFNAIRYEAAAIRRLATSLL